MKRFVFLAAVAACTSSSDPFELDHAQILAVRAEPAHAPPGTAVRIDVLAGDDAGDVFEAVPDAVDAGPLAAERRADGWYVTSPAPLAPAITVTLRIDGQPWAATKQLVFAELAANPSLAEMPPVQAIRGTKPQLAASAAGADPLSYAWYTSLGTLEHYRQPAAILDAEAAGDGIVCVVVRDAQGGVAWQTIPAHVE
ncbi:MAG: hypothetical protein ACM31C_24330 [Acidobacteriota bacterium]